jgi:hypothetical protein
MPDITIQLIIRESQQPKLIAYLDKKYPKPDGVSYTNHFLNLTKQKWINEIQKEELTEMISNVQSPTAIEID